MPGAGDPLTVGQQIIIPGTGGPPAPETTRTVTLQDRSNWFHANLEELAVNTRTSEELVRRIGLQPTQDGQRFATYWGTRRRPLQQLMTQNGWDQRMDISKMVGDLLGADFLF
jgi:hypothetical protein